MKTYKAPNNSLHCIEPDFLHMLPAGSVEITDAEADALRAAQNAKTPAQLESDFTAAIQNRLDEFARTRNYDGILSACTYATSTVPKFQLEGQYCVQVRDATWAAAYVVLDRVMAGNWPTNGASQMPTGITDIEVDLPALAWPPA